MLENSITFKQIFFNTWSKVSQKNKCISIVVLLVFNFKNVSRLYKHPIYYWVTSWIHFLNFSLFRNHGIKEKSFRSINCWIFQKKHLVYRQNQPHTEAPLLTSASSASLQLTCPNHQILPKHAAAISRIKIWELTSAKLFLQKNQCQSVKADSTEVQ